MGYTMVGRWTFRFISGSWPVSQLRESRGRVERLLRYDLTAPSYRISFDEGALAEDSGRGKSIGWLLGIANDD
jgi:hypothetical protein